VSLIEKGFAYTAGLLHDIGRLALIASQPAQYVKLLLAAEENPCDVLERERQVFGVDHCEAGRWMAEAWKLPKEFAAVTSRHHAEPDAGKSDIVVLVHRSCLFADTLGFAAVRPLRPRSFEEVLSGLPEHERMRFSPEPAELTLKIATKINSVE